MRYIEIKKREIICILLLLLPERMCFFINRSFFQSIFHIDYSDCVMIVYLFLFLYVIQRTKQFDFGKYYFAYNILLIIPLVIMAAVVPMFLFKQAFGAGFWIQRNFTMMVVCYFMVRTLFLNKIILPEYLWKIMYVIAFFITGLMIFQHSISNYVRFLDVGYSKRFGVRITDNFTYSTILLIGSLILYCITVDKKEKIISIVGIIMSFYHCVFVSQTRIVMAAYGGLTIAMAILFDNKLLKKAIYMLIICGGGYFVMKSDLGQYFLTAVTDTSSDPSAQIREIGKSYYLNEISKTPFVGRGYPGSYAAYEASGIYDKIALNDNGLYGFAYIYGIIGFVWYLAITIKMFICSFKAFKKGDYRFILFTLFLQVISVNIIWWYWRFSFGLVFSIMLAMMEEYQNNETAPNVGIYLGK